MEHYAHGESISGESLIFGGDSSWYNIGRMFESLLSDDDFKDLPGHQGGKLGNHSIRKGACTTPSGLDFQESTGSAGAAGEPRSRSSTYTLTSTNHTLAVEPVVILWS